MTISRRSFLAAGTVAGLAGTSALWVSVRAQGSYPSQPVRLVVPYAPGGGSDFTGRLIAQKLQETAGFTVIVDNRPCCRHAWRRRFSHWMTDQLPNRLAISPGSTKTAQRPTPPKPVTTVIQSSQVLSRLTLNPSGSLRLFSSRICQAPIER